jgi:hypothetical protein
LLSLVHFDPSVYHGNLEFRHFEILGVIKNCVIIKSQFVELLKLLCQLDRRNPAHPIIQIDCHSSEQFALHGTKVPFRPRLFINQERIMLKAYAHIV